MSPARIPLSFFLALALVFVLGGIMGGMLTVRWFGETQVSLREDVRPPVPTLSIAGTENGALVGEAQGTLRVLVDGKPIVVAPGEFRIPVSSLKSVVTVVAPDGMRFVASRQGKKYYDITSASAARLAPQNRVYFRTAADAEAAGYMP